ncbi:MAG: type IV pilus modification PilV family protein [Planctomycetota bacterium]|jgi:type II secretory pathway pseudopilin PulG
MKRINSKNRKGFSLAEAMIATVVLGAAAAGVLLPFTTGARVQVEGTRRTLAAKLAGDLMEEVVGTPFDAIIANYNYSEAQGQIKDASGTVFGDLNYARFSRDVSSELVYVAQQDGTKTPNFIKVTVRVYYDGAEIAIINRLINQ